MVEKKQQKQIDDAIAYKAVFGGRDGKRVLRDLIKTSGMLTADYRGDPYEIVFREGQRAMVNRILNILKINPSKLQVELDRMAKEEESFYGNIDG